jgi:hypothetical protein
VIQWPNCETSLLLPIRSVTAMGMDTGLKAQRQVAVQWGLTQLVTCTPHIPPRSPREAGAGEEEGSAEG